MYNFVMVGIGGLIGSVLRYSVALMIKSTSFPFATLTVNVIGSFVIGLVLGVSLKNPDFNQQWRIFLATGVCGGFTTFSSFAFENLGLLRSGNYTYFLLYAAGSLLFGIF